MKPSLYLLIISLFIGQLATAQEYKMHEMPTGIMQDKIKGGWAGQVVGVTYGGPTEFKYNATWINDYTPIEWYDGLLKQTYKRQPGLYDDIYMDLTFVEVLEVKGFDATAKDFALAFAHAEYDLWHANQQARYNILHGIMPPASGHWQNNPEATSIDFQIEADFAGLMCPGMPNSAARICDTVGHIMNYGSGWYGGVYVAGMYSLAFVFDDVGTIVREALKLIPKESEYYQCMNDVVRWHGQHPEDWRMCWHLIERHYGEDKGSPLGVFQPFNITATVNSAYVVMALLYGGGDFGRTVDIATRAGNDSDCNPATAAGILGTMMGYKAIPEKWKLGLDEVEDMEFKYTDMSLNDVYELSNKHALTMIEMEGGNVGDEPLSIQTQAPKTVRLEVCMPDEVPIDRLELTPRWKDELQFTFEGTGFALLAEPKEKKDTDHIFEVDVYIDGELDHSLELPADFRTRRFIPVYKYGLESKEHKVRLVLKNPTEDAVFRWFIGKKIQVIVYDKAN